MSPPRRRAPAEELALNAYVKLMRCAESVTARAHTVLPKGLTLTQFAVLEALYHLGPRCQSEIAGKLLKSGGNITLVVDNLEKQGLVERERSQEDRRYITVRLSEKGRALIAGLFPKLAAGLTRELSALTSAEQRELARLCKKLGLAGGEA